MFKQMEKKSIKNKKLFYLLLFACSVIFYLSICIPLLYLVDKFTIYWFVFGLIAFVLPFFFFLTTAIFFPSDNFEKKQKFEKYKFFVVPTFYLWFLDIFYMCIFNGWLIGIWCFGLLILVLNIISLIKCFLKKDQVKQLIPLHIVAIIFLTIILIYMIEIKELQDIITAIVAALYGGLLTLGGVAWSIKHNKEERILAESKRDEERKLEEEKKYCPLFNIFKCNNDIYPKSFMKISWSDFNDIRNVTSLKNKNVCFNKISVKQFVLENTDYTAFYFRGIQINSKIYERPFNLFVKKESYIVFDFDNKFLYLDEPLNEINLIVENLLGNVYNVSLGIAKAVQDDYEAVEIYGSRRIQL